jgi:Secretion system C-terminal sorting domain
MKKQLQKKLSTFIVISMMFSASANAQIVYTDVIPDSTMLDNILIGLNTKNYNLDLDNNTNDDFILSASYGPDLFGVSVSVVYASPLNGNALKDTLTTGNVPIPLQLNAVIDSNLLLQQSWQTSGSHTLRRSGGIGPVGLWNNLSDYYLGLRLLQSGQTYYGWVRLRVNVTSSYASVIVRDYAYNSIPDQPILAGQTTITAITENSFASLINLFPNPATNQLTIALGNNTKKAEVTITDISGKLIYTTTTTDAQKIEVNTKEFAEGIYVVQIQTADFIAKKKLVIAK